MKTPAQLEFIAKAKSATAERRPYMQMVTEPISSPDFGYTVNLNELLVARSSKPTELLIFGCHHIDMYMFACDMVENGHIYYGNLKYDSAMMSAFILNAGHPLIAKLMLGLDTVDADLDNTEVVVLIPPYVRRSCIYKADSVKNPSHNIYLELKDSAEPVDERDIFKPPTNSNNLLH